MKGIHLDDKSAGGETRTLMDRSPGDFESPASTNFTTPAWTLKFYEKNGSMSRRKNFEWESKKTRLKREMVRATIEMRFLNLKNDL